MAHTPLKITIPEAQSELDKPGTLVCPNVTKRYRPARGRGMEARIMHFVMRLAIPRIYIPQMNKRTWVK